jgi:formylglycine-generating enzyme required for sulfatase activity
MKNRMTATRTGPVRPGGCAPLGRWLALALVAGFTLAAQAQRTATATATVSGGAVTSIAVTDGGAAYSQAPVVILAGGGGTGATATAVLTSDAVSQINVMTGGSGYTNAPDVILSAPPGQPTVLGLQMIPLLTIYGRPGDTNWIETSASLGAGAVWIPLTNVVLTSSVYEWYDRISPAASRGFYRAVRLGGTGVDAGLRLGLQMIPLLTIYGRPGATNRIETSASLGAGAVWIPLTYVVLTSSVYEWYDRISPAASRDFYRAVLLGGTQVDAGLRFVWLPPGQFVMGSPASEVDRVSNEGPQTRVTLTRGFYLGRYPVTQGEYLSVIGSNPSSFTGDTNRPVEMVNWSNATNYCAQLTARERTAGRLPAGWAYRLPTEAEYEYASRAGSTNRFSYGDDPGYTRLGNYAWYSANSSAMTHAVGGKLPNRWGLYDIAGNVWQWCSDWYGTYPGGNVTDPSGSVSGSSRVIRGGSWDYYAYYCRSAQRYNYYPTLRSRYIGFRVVLAPGQ